MLLRAHGRVRGAARGEGRASAFRGILRLILTGVAVAACAPPGLAAQDRPEAPDFEPVRQLIRTHIAEGELPSVAVAVARHGEIIWEEGFGWADRERGIRATSHTPYSVASISKPITATGIMRLVERGELDLDRPANDYLGAGRIRAPMDRRAHETAGATLRRVLSHTAGLPLHYRFFYDGENYGRPSMDESIDRYAILINEPGTVYEYSNIGYGVLDHIIERVSGRSYAEFMRREVFAPLGMTRSYVHTTPEPDPHAAVRYDGRQRPLPFYDFDHRGASAVWSSAHDLARFGMFHLGERIEGAQEILDPASIAAMQRVETPYDTARGYGLGWIVGEDGGFRRVSHTGGMPGVSTVLNFYPSERTVIVVLTNSSDRIVQTVAREIARIVLPRYETTPSDARGTAGSGAAAGRSGDRGPTESVVGRWRGVVHTYEGTVPIELVVRPNGEANVRLAGERRVSVRQPLVLPDQFVGRFPGMIPTQDARRHPHSVVLNLHLRDGRLTGSATAQTTDDPIHFALTSYVELHPDQD